MYSLSFNRCIYPHNKDIEHFHSKGASSLCNQSPPQSETSTHLMPIAIGWFCLLERHRNILLITMKFLIFIQVVACISSSEFFSLGTVDILNRIILCLGDCPVHVGLFSSIPEAIRSHLLEAISTSLSSGNSQKCVQTLLDVQWRTKSPPYCT